MTTDTIEAPAEASPSAAVANPADVASPQTLPQGEQVEGQQQPAEGAAPEDPEAKARRVQDATQRRISRLVGERAQERARREQLEREHDSLRQRLSQYEQPAADPEPALRRALGPDDVRREAAALVEAQEFVKQCNAVVAKGRAAFPDFEASLATLATVTGPLLDERGQPEPLLSAVLDGADEPHKVLKHLAAHPDIAADLLDLSPRKQAARIALLERDLKAPARQPSAAPLPLTPVKAVADTDGEPDSNDTARWIAWRNKQERARRAR